MDALIAFLSTTAGKAIAGLTIASASAGGLHAAEVIELPVLPDQAQEHEEVEVDAGAEGADLADTAEEGRDGAQVAEDAKAEAGAEGDVEIESDHTRQATGASEMDVAGDAQDGGVDGQTHSDEVIANTPAADKVPAQAGAPEGAGEQGQEHRESAPVPEQAGGADDGDLDEQTVDEDEDAEDAGEPAPQADEHRPVRD